MNTENSGTEVAIIGLGKVGEAIATNLTKGNHTVILASRDIEKAQLLAAKLGGLAVAKDVAHAIREADVVIPAINFNSLKDFFQAYASELADKTVVNVSNPIAPDGNGGFKKIVGQGESAGQILSGLLPGSARLVKAFGTLGAASLRNEAFSKPGRKVLFYASDHASSNKQIEELITISGFEPLLVGGIDQSIRLEVFGDLHEFGGLGKTVTVDEARAKV